MRGAAVLLLALLLSSVARASDGELEAVARARLPVVERAWLLGTTAPESLQAQYDVARDLEEAVRSTLPVRRCGDLAAAALGFARGVIRYTEGADRLSDPIAAAGKRQAGTWLARSRRLGGRCRGGTFLAPPRRRADAWRRVALRTPVPARGGVASLSSGLAALGRSFDGYAGFWVHDLRTGRSAGWNADARFPAASLVKLGLLAAALEGSMQPGRSPDWYDVAAMTTWSSNLAANRLFVRVGGAPVVEAALRRLGALSSTYPQGYRVGTSAAADIVAQPPLVSSRVTTASDLGRVLLNLHRAAAGGPGAVLERGRARLALGLLLASDAAGDNVGLLRRALPGVPLAQKHGWFSSVRHTAAIVHGRRGSTIVVLLTYRDRLPLADAQALAARLVALLRREGLNLS